MCTYIYDNYSSVASYLIDKCTQLMKICLLAHPIHDNQSYLVRIISIATYCIYIYVSDHYFGLLSIQ